MQFQYPEGATPLDQDEMIGLLPIHITTQGQLNEWEQLNIIEAEKWALSRKQPNILSIAFCLKLHKKMFDKTWSWAGTFRRSNKNIGVFWEQVSQQLRLLFDDAAYQVHHDVYPVGEIAARLHHRLVYIHPFANGNGRHSRLFADIFLNNNNVPVFTWGNKSLFKDNKTRIEYIRALRLADKGDYSLLLKFVRS